MPGAGAPIGDVYDSLGRTPGDLHPSLPPSWMPLHPALRNHRRQFSCRIQPKEVPIRKLIASLYVSLDGFAADSSERMSWVTDDFDEDITSYSLDELRGRVAEADVLVVSGLWRNELIEAVPKLRFIQSISAGEGPTRSWPLIGPPPVRKKGPLQSS